MLPTHDRQMRMMMKKMGINMKEIRAERVVIETADKQYVFSDPSVTVMDMKGQKTYQITGTVSVTAKLNEADVALVAEQSGKSPEEARAALAATGGDIAEAILRLTSA